MKKRKITKLGWLIALATGLSVISFGIVLKVEAPKGVSIFEPVKEEVKIPEPPPIPETFALSVPYTVQAPFTNWAVHEESCEEAAVLMYHHYLLGEGAGVLEQYQVDADLRKLRAWQITNWGPEKDLDLSWVGKLASGYYGYSYKVKEDIKAEDIKREISEGRPVLVPVMTHSLLNPHYGRENTYHILVITGYDAAGVTTNDAGIKEGQDYRYTWDVLFGAIDAQTSKMGQGRDLLVITM
jgi:hypothetical protein